MIIFNSNQLIFPSIISSEGAFLIKNNGQKLFDTWIGSGSLIFGHDKESMTVELDLLPTGTTITNAFINLINDLVSFEVGGFGLQTSGSSAVTRALRLARTITGKNRIAVVNKFWHGSDNELLFSENKKIISLGIPQQHQTEVEWFNTVDNFLNTDNVEQYSALILEPYQGSDPSISLLNSINSSERKRLKDSGVLLICDEIITGFRERYGSCNASRNVKPDIVIFGKALGLGFPVGLVVVNKEILHNLNQLPFWGGTFSSSPTQIVRINESLRKLKALDYSKIKLNHDSLIEIINHFAIKYDYLIKSGCLFSRILSINECIESRAFLTSKNGFNELRRKLEENNIFVGSNALLFPSIFSIGNN